MSANGPMSLPVLSGSMMPYLRPGGQVVVERVPDARCHPGDIIVFRESTRLIAHRVLLRVKFGRRFYYYQKGDSAGCGHWIPEAKLIGVVTRSVDPDGTCLYQRGVHDYPVVRSVCQQLLRDLLIRAKSTVKAVWSFRL